MTITNEGPKRFMKWGRDLRYYDGLFALIPRHDVPIL